MSHYVLKSINIILQVCSQEDYDEAAILKRLRRPGPLATVAPIPKSWTETVAAIRSVRQDFDMSFPVKEIRRVKAKKPGKQQGREGSVHYTEDVLSKVSSKRPRYGISVEKTNRLSI